MRAAALLLLALAACGPSAPQPEPSSPAPGLMDGMVRWREQGIRDYTVQLTVSCFCRHRGEYRMTVRDGGLHSAQNSGGVLVDADVAVLLPTVDGLYRQIADAMLAGMPVRVALDPALSYPTETAIGTPENDAGVVYRMRDLRPAGR